MNKIAIPSNDKINIADEFTSAKIFLIFEAGNGFLSNAEIRKNPVEANSDLDLTSEQKNLAIFNKLCDCNIIICRKINHELLEYFKSSGVPVLRTLEINARKGVINMVCR